MSDLNADNFTKDCILQYQVKVASDVSLGDLVYYDTSSQNPCYKRAIAQLAVDSNNQRYPTKKCFIQGMIVAKESTGNSYILLRQGYFKSPVIANTLDDATAAGIYYLSESNSGKATNVPSQDVKIPCISYYGGYAFSLTPSHYVRIDKSQNVLKNLVSQTLDISNSGQGILRIEQPQKDLETFSSYPFAIASLTPRKITYTPVVSKLFSGPGIQIADLQNGRWQVSAKSILNSKLTATDFTLNGTQRAADNLLTYTVFPANATTSMIMAMPINFIQNSDSFNGTVDVWMTTRGPGTVTYNIAVYWIPYQDNTQIPTTTNYIGSINAYNSSTTALSLVQTAPIPISLKGQGIMLAKIQTASAPADDCYVHQAGFQFAQVTTEQEVATPEAAPAVPLTEQAIRNIIAEYLRWQS